MSTIQILQKIALLDYITLEPREGLEPREKAQNLKDHLSTQNSPAQMFPSISHHQSIPSQNIWKVVLIFLILMPLLCNKTESVFVNRSFPVEESNYLSIFGFRPIVITHKTSAVEIISICISVLHFLNDVETSINSPTLFQDTFFRDCLQLMYFFVVVWPDRKIWCKLFDSSLDVKDLDFSLRHYACPLR